MAQIIRGLTGDEIAFDFDETLTKLTKALPKDHPVVKEIADLFQTAGSNLEDMSVALQGEAPPSAREFIERDHDGFIEILEDWRRGIRDWDEVEEALKDVRYFRENLDGVRKGDDVAGAARHGRRPA